MEDIVVYKVWNCRQCKKNEWQKLLIQPHEGETLYQCRTCHKVINFHQPEVVTEELYLNE